jgi:ankyrin repeat protein
MPNYKGLSEAAKERLRNGVTPNGYKLLTYAAIEGDLDSVRDFISEVGFDPHIDGYAPFFYAIQYGHLPIVKYYVENVEGTPVDNKLTYHFIAKYYRFDILTYIMSKVNNKYAKIVKFIIDNYKDIQDNSGNVIQIAIEKGAIEIVKLLGESRIDIHQNHEEALRRACAVPGDKGLEMVKYFVEDLKSNIHTVQDPRSKYYEDTLYQAVGNGNLKVVKYLKYKGANIHDRNDELIRQAVIFNHLPIVSYLYKNGANISTNYEAAMRLSAKYGHTDIFKFLVDNGADHSVRSYAALFSAIKIGNLDIVEYIVEQGIDDKVLKKAIEKSKKIGQILIVSFLSKITNTSKQITNTHVKTIIKNPWKKWRGKKNSKRSIYIQQNIYTTI